MTVADLIKRHEGLRLKPYLCPAGKLTIGFGRNLEDRGITEEEAEGMLLSDLAEIEHELTRTYPWYRHLSEPRQAVLISMAYNLGMTGLSKFTGMLSALQRFDFERAASEMLASRWSSQVGKRAVELATMMREDRFPGARIA